MNLAAGASVYGLDGTSYRLGPLIAQGGQGAVFSLEGHRESVAKFYFGALGQDDIAKLTVMCRLKSEALTRIAAWPMALLKPTPTGAPQGLLMPKVTGFESIHQLYGLKSRLRVFPEAQFPFLLHAAINSARAFATIHAAGQVIGDVNHSNLMISQNATAALIDCDSFQISANGRTFLCPVGVPEFTAPELQGRSFQSQPRTPQQDVFGLAILIFYLLFLGRHPFMGLFDPKKDEMVALDQAIGRYAFPYALDPRSPEVNLPPSAPRLSDYPSTLGDLFQRAFTKAAGSGGRPTATTWVDALSGLANSLKQCAINPAHHFYNAVRDCPWCRTEGVLGTPIFGIKISIGHDGRFNLTKIWLEIESIKPQAENLQKPDLAALAASFQVDPALPAIVYRRQNHRLAALALVVAVSVAAVSALAALPAVLMIAVVLAIARAICVRGGVAANPYRERLRHAARAYGDAEAVFDNSAAPPASFLTERQKLGDAKIEYERLGPQKAARLAALQAERERQQRRRFLESFLVNDEKIPTIGTKYSAILRNFGIEDAWDIEEARISAIKGFGPVKIQALLSWRKSKENLFRFDPRQPVDPLDLKALEQEFAQKTQVLQNILLSGPQRLRQMLTAWNAQRRQSALKLAAVARELAQAELNQKALKMRL